MTEEEHITRAMLMELEYFNEGGIEYYCSMKEGLKDSRSVINAYTLEPIPAQKIMQSVVYKTGVLEYWYIEGTLEINYDT